MTYLCTVDHIHNTRSATVHVSALKYLNHRTPENQAYSRSYVQYPEHCTSTCLKGLSHGTRGNRWSGRDSKEKSLVFWLLRGRGASEKSGVLCTYSYIPRTYVARVLSHDTCHDRYDTFQLLPMKLQYHPVCVAVLFCLQLPVRTYVARGNDCSTGPSQLLFFFWKKRKFWARHGELHRVINQLVFFPQRSVFRVGMELR